MADEKYFGNPEETDQEIGDITLHLNTTREFLDIIKQLDSIAGMHKCSYDETRSLYQAIAKGVDVAVIEQKLAQFFGEPSKVAGESIPLKLRLNPSIKYLHGVRDEQTLFIRKTKTGVYYGALWPWQKKPGNVTVHLGFISNKMSDKDYKKLEKIVKARVLNERIIEELDSGGGTKVRDLGLAAFLQMAELDKTTCTLAIRHGSHSGYLYLLQGEIVAAETGRLSNKEAAYEIISWEQTNIDIDDRCKIKRNEINQPLMHILTESLARRKRRVPAAEGEPPPEQETVAPRPSGDQFQRAARQAKRIKRKRIIATVVVVLIVGMAAAAALTFISGQRTRAAFEKARTAATQAHTARQGMEILQAFVDAHPSGLYSQRARALLSEYRQRAATQMYAESIQQVDALPIDRNFQPEASAIYEEFLTLFPDGPQSEDIQRRLDAIPAQVDAFDFKNLKEIAPQEFGRRVEAYRRYLANHPTGEHYQTVKSMLEDLRGSFYQFVKKQARDCETTGRWQQCAQLCQEFTTYFPNDHRAAEIQRLKAAMDAQVDLAALDRRISDEGLETEGARRLYQQYLEDHPLTPARAQIQRKLIDLEQEIQRKREWQNLVAFVNDGRNDLGLRTAKLRHYLDRYPEGPRHDEAAALLRRLQGHKPQKRQEPQGAERQEKVDQRRVDRLSQQRRQARLEATRQAFRSRLTKAGGRFTAHGDGTFTDKNTGLLWTLLDSYSELGRCLRYDEAVRYVKGLNTGGYRDWRLPTANELAGLYKSKPYLPSSGAAWYWSSEKIIKGYHRRAYVVTTEQEEIFQRDHRELDDCGAARAVRR
jgi:type II secretory pathway pseudopilin PulG